MGWKYDGAAITGAKYNGVEVTQGKYNGSEFWQASSFDLDNFRISGVAYLKMKLQAGLTARSNGQVMLWNDGSDDTATGSILDGAQAISGLSGVDMDLIRVAKWDDAQQRIILNTSTTTGNFHDDVFTGGIRASMVFENGGTIFTLGDPRSGGANWADWWVSGGQINQSMFDAVDGVAAGDAFMVAIHSGAATYSETEPMPSGPVLADWTLPSGKQSAPGGPGEFVAAAGVGVGGYGKGMWMRTTDVSGVGFGQLSDGTFQYTVGGVLDLFDDIKFRDDSGQARMAVSRTTDPDTVNTSITNFLSALSGSEFMIQTENRTMRLPTATSTDRSQGANWISWWLHGSGNANAMLTQDDIDELNRVREAGDRFLAGFIYNT